MPTTTRWGLRYPELTGTDAADVPLWMSRLASDLDTVAMDDQGPLDFRPDPGTGVGEARKGSYYIATDTGQLRSWPMPPGCAISGRGRGC